MPATVAASRQVPAVTGGLTSSIITNNSASGTIAWAWTADVNHLIVNTVGSVSFSAFTGLAQGRIGMLTIKLGGAGHTLSFSGVTWRGNATPTWSTLSGATVVISFYYDGTTLRSTGVTQYTS